MKGSLSRIACDLNIRFIGNAHQAGSDSLVTAKVYFKLLNDFGEQVDLAKDQNKLFGFNYSNNYVDRNSISNTGNIFSSEEMEYSFYLSQAWDGR